MLPEQIPGSLFVLLTFALALGTNSFEAAALIALGCAFGWLTFNPVRGIAVLGLYGSFSLWTWGTLWLLSRIFL